MAFVATIDPDDASAPDYAGTRKIERWTATALTSDSGPATITARNLSQVDDFQVQHFGGSPPANYSVSGRDLVLTLPGGGWTATKYKIRLEGRK